MTATTLQGRHAASIIVPSLFAILIGAAIVFLTSPNITSIRTLTSNSIDNQTTLDIILSLHALVTDLTFVFLISFLFLCNYDPSAKWIARNQSFPYSYSPSWNFGPRSFDFQLLIFEIFHVGWISRWIHMLGIVFEEGLWAIIVHLTFGKWGLAVLLFLLSLQTVSYRDVWISVGILVVNSIIVGGCYWIFEILVLGSWLTDTVLVLSVVKALLFWTVTTRTLSHVLEPLPPTYRPEVECFDNNFGVVGWKLCLSDLPRALWLVILGNVSEFGAGMPGRLFNAVVYKCMYKAGFRSCNGLLDVTEAKVQAWEVIEYGWMGHPETARMYDWALQGGVSLQDREMLDEKSGLV